MEVSLYHAQRLLERAAPVRTPHLSPFLSSLLYPKYGELDVARISVGHSQAFPSCNADHCPITHFPTPMPENTHLPARMLPVT